jgi:O-antigen/teichoic acid export membrane protein
MFIYGSYLSCTQDMKREFAINIGLLLIANLFIKAFYLLGIDRQMQLAVGTDIYGMYYNLFNITLIFQFINDFGIQNYTNRHVSQNRESIRREYKDFAGLKILLSVLYITAIFLFVWIMDYPVNLYSMIFHLACNQVLVSGIFFVRSNISGLGFYKTDSFFSVLDRILLIVFGSFLLWHPFFKSLLSIESFVWIQTISLSCTLIAVIVFIKLKQLHFSFWLIDIFEIKKIMRSCVPFAMIFLFSSLYNKIDIILIGKLLEDGNHQAGIYASSMRLYEACSMISLAFGSLLLAMFSALYNEPGKLSELFKMAMNGLMVITLVIVLSCVFYPKEIISLLYHQSDPYWSEIFGLTMFAFLPGSLNYIFGALFPALHKEKQLVWIYIFASLISFTVNYFLILQLKVVGAAYAAIATQSILFIVQFIYVYQFRLIELDFKYWKQLILFALMSVLIVYGIQQLDFSWVLKIVVTFIGIILLAILQKMISPQDFIEFKGGLKEK